LSDKRRPRLCGRWQRHGGVGRAGRIGSAAADESGFTLIELLVAMAIGLVVGAAALTFMIVTFEEQNTISSRTVATNQAEQGLEQLVRDLRDAMTSVSISSGASTTSISFQIPTPGNDSTGEPVTWTCPSTANSATYIGICTRALTQSGGTTTRNAIVGVQSMSFSPLSSSNTSMSLPVASSTTVASVGMTLTVQITSYELTANGTTTTILPGAGSGPGTPSTPPIVLQATADLRNFG
jgi:prepilin-type N-terminal cleavage/methylation domain-containing protein